MAASSTAGGCARTGAKRLAKTKKERRTPDSPALPRVFEEAAAAVRRLDTGADRSVRAAGMDGDFAQHGGVTDVDVPSKNRR